MDDDALERMYARIRADNKAWAEGEQQRKATRMQRYLKLANRMASKIPQREEKVRSRLKRYLQEKHDVSGPLSNEELQGYLEAWLPRGWLEIKQRRMAEAIEDDDIRRSTYAALLWTTHAEEETTKMHCEDYLDFWDEGDKVYWTYELE